MKQYQKSVVAFLKQTGLPVYSTGQVPSGATFPFITLTTAYAPFAQSAGLTVTAWFREEHAHTRCVETMDALCATVPEASATQSMPMSSITAAWRCCAGQRAASSPW